MNLVPTPILESETVVFGQQEVELFELSAYHRCEYLQKTTEDIPLPQDEELPETELENFGQLWAFRKGEVSKKLLLVAYAIWMKPDCQDSLEDIHHGLIRSVTPKLIDQLYIPAAKLSGLFVDVQTEKADSETESEETEKKG
ncbi:phage minor tail protein G [Microbulbifer variabilis]|uniref:phage minor tail protein G n=1 Tax=Microbulbifer variabilis TaxID=266805 RepID=UPI001CFD0C5F|nr:phage minor tail protein G [Microbulbifer variabilis]